MAQGRIRLRPCVGCAAAIIAVCRLRAVLGTGGVVVGDIVGEAVPGGRDHRAVLDGVALLAVNRLTSVLRAGRLLVYCEISFPGMPRGVQVPRFDIVTTAALALFASLVRAVRRSDGFPFSHVVIQGRNRRPAGNLLPAAQAIDVAGVAVHCAACRRSIAHLRSAHMVFAVQCAICPSAICADCLVFAGCRATGMHGFCVFMAADCAFLPMVGFVGFPFIRIYMSFFRNDNGKLFRIRELPPVVCGHHNFIGSRLGNCQRLVVLAFRNQLASPIPLPGIGDIAGRMGRNSGRQRHLSAFHRRDVHALLISSEGEGGRFQLP